MRLRGTLPGMDYKSRPIEIPTDEMAMSYMRANAIAVRSRPNKSGLVAPPLTSRCTPALHSCLSLGSLLGPLVVCPSVSPLGCLLVPPLQGVGSPPHPPLAVQQPAPSREDGHPERHDRGGLHGLERNAHRHAPHAVGALREGARRAPAGRPADDGRRPRPVHAATAARKRRLLCG